MKNFIAAVIALFVGLGAGGCTTSQTSIGPMPPSPTSPPHVDLSGIGQTIGSFGGGVAGGFTGSVTATALSSFVDGISADLKNVGHSLGGDAMIATDHAAGELSSLEDQFNQMLHGQVAVPINNLSYEVQDAAQQLNSLATRLQAILSSQQDALYVNVDVFTAGIETAALEIKGGFFMGPKGSPRIFYYAFAGMMPELVPKGGGTMTVTGYRLWETAPPKVNLLNSGGDVITELQPQRGASDNSIVVTIGPGLIQTNSGQVLQLRVVPQELEKSWFSSKTTQLTPLQYPIVVPSDYSMGFRVAAHISYPVITTKSEDLPPQNFGFDNNSCSNAPQVSLTRHWDVPPGGKIVSHKDDQVYNVNDNNITILTTSDTEITASGSMDRATCVRGPFGVGEIYQHEASWSYKVTPTVEYPVTTEGTSDGAASANALTFPSTQILVDIKKDQPSDSTTYWFELYPVINGKEGPVFYQSPKVTVGTGLGSTPSFTQSGFSIQGTLNPQISSGSTQLSVVIGSNGRTHN